MILKNHIKLNVQLNIIIYFLFFFPDKTLNIYSMRNKRSRVLSYKRGPDLVRIKYTSSLSDSWPHARLLF